MQKLTINQSAKNKCQWDAQPQMEYLSHVTPGTSQGLRITMKEGAEKIVRPEQDSVFWTRQDCYTPELMAAVVACTRPVQV